MSKDCIGDVLLVLMVLVAAESHGQARLGSLAGHCLLLHRQSCSGFTRERRLVPGYWHPPKPLPSPCKQVGPMLTLSYVPGRPCLFIVCPFHTGTSPFILQTLCPHACISTKRFGLAGPALSLSEQVTGTLSASVSDLWATCSV